MPLCQGFLLTDDFVIRRNNQYSKWLSRDSIGNDNQRKQAFTPTVAPASDRSPWPAAPVGSPTPPPLTRSPPRPAASPRGQPVECRTAASPPAAKAATP